MIDPLTKATRRRGKGTILMSFEVCDGCVQLEKIKIAIELSSLLTWLYRWVAVLGGNLRYIIPVLQMLNNNLKCSMLDTSDLGT